MYRFFLGDSSSDQLKEGAVTVAGINLISSGIQELTSSLIHDSIGSVTDNTDMAAVNGKFLLLCFVYLFLVFL